MFDAELLVMGNVVSSSTEEVMVGWGIFVAVVGELPRSIWSK